MYKLENLKNELQNITKDPFDGFIMNHQLKEMVNQLLKIEKEFKSINNNYDIDFSPISSHHLNDHNLNVRLLFNNQEICSQNTTFNFFLYGLSDEYESSQFSDPKRGIQREIKFKKKPQLYIQILENNFIKSFLSNEKSIIKQVVANEFNTNLRIKDTYKINI